MAKPRSVDLSNPFLDNLEGVCELLLVRHGEQQYVRDMTIADGVNPPLSPLGQQQAAAVGERLADQQIDVVYASPLTRAFDTGNAIAQHHGLAPIIDDDLQEVDLWGKIDQSKSLKENLPADEIRAIFRESQRTQSWDASLPGTRTSAAAHASARVGVMSAERGFPHPSLGFRLSFGRPPARH